MTQEKSKSWFARARHSLYISMFVVFFLQSSATAQLVISGVPGDLCDDIIGGGDSESYEVFQRTSGGPIECWVHTHPNGIDKVVVPYSWGTVPPYEAGGLQFVTSAFEALTESRDVFAGIDGPLETPITVFFVFNVLGIDRPAFDAAAIQSSDYSKCMIHYYGRRSWHRSPSSGDPVYVLKQVLAHEIGHCYNNDKITGSVDWAEEAGAEFLGALVYPNINLEHEWSVEFDLDGSSTRDFRQDYAGFILFEYVRQKSGLAAAYRLIKRLQDDARRTHQFSTLNSAIDFHQFAIDFLQGNILDPGCSPVACNYPRENPLSALQAVRLVEATYGHVALDPAPGGQLVMYQLFLNPGMVADLHTLENLPSDVGVSFSERVGASAVPWRPGLSISTSCESEGLPAVLLLTHLQINKLERIKLGYSSKPRSDCNEESGTSSLVGKWYATANTKKLLYSEIYADPITVENVTGEMIMIFRPDGTASLVWNDVTVFMGGDYALPPTRTNGENRYKWVIEDGKLRLTGLSTNVRVKAAGIEIPYSQTGFNAVADVEYTINDTALIIDTGIPQTLSGVWMKR